MSEKQSCLNSIRKINLYIQDTPPTRLFFKPNLLKKLVSSADVDKERRTEFYLNPHSYSFLEEDFLEFEIPEGYKAEYVPKEIKLSKKLGGYSALTSVVGNRLIFTRRLKIIGGLYYKSDLTTWINFLKIISKADNQKAVFVKNQ